jgi:hypothetical protein
MQFRSIDVHTATTANFDIAIILVFITRRQRTTVRRAQPKPQQMPLLIGKILEFSPVVQDLMIVYKLHIAWLEGHKQAEFIC